MCEVSKQEIVERTSLTILEERAAVFCAMTALPLELMTSVLKASALSNNSWYCVRSWSILLLRSGLGIGRALEDLTGVDGWVEDFLERVDRECMMRVRV